jgi:hypothetical protein
MMAVTKAGDGIGLVGCLEPRREGPHGGIGAKHIHFHGADIGLLVFELRQRCDLLGHRLRSVIIRRHGNMVRRHHVLDLLRALPREGIVERGGGGVDGGEGLSLAGAGLRQAGAKTENEDEQGCCSQGYTPLTLRLNSALVTGSACIGAEVTLSRSPPTGSRTMPSPALHASKL